MHADRVMVDSDTLMRQAPMTAATYMIECIAIIDSRFGKGFAEANPQLLASMVLACAIDLGGAVIARALDHLPSRLPGGSLSE